MTEKRVETIVLKVTKTEKQQIRAKAETVRLGMSEYIRSYLEIHPNSPRSPYLRKILENRASSAMFNRSATPNGQP